MISPVGMTKGVGVAFSEVSEWDGESEICWSVKTADPSTALRSGRDDKGGGVAFSEVSEWDGESEICWAVKTADPSTALRSVEKHSTGGELKTVGAPYLALSARCGTDEAEQPCLSG